MLLGLFTFDLVNRFSVLRPKSREKFQIDSMIFVITTKAKVKLKKMAYLVYINFYGTPFPFLSFHDSALINIFLISHTLGFIILFLDI